MSCGPWRCWHPVAQASLGRTARARSRWSAPPDGTTWTGQVRYGYLRWTTGRGELAGGIPDRPGPGRAALAAGGPIRVVGPEAPPAGGYLSAYARSSRPVDAR